MTFRNFGLVQSRAMVLSTVEVGQFLLAEREDGFVGNVDDPHGITTDCAADDCGLFSDGLWRVPADQPIHPTEKQCHQPADFVESNFPLAAPHPSIVADFSKATWQADFGITRFLVEVSKETQQPRMPAQKACSSTKYDVTISPSTLPRPAAAYLNHAMDRSRRARPIFKTTHPRRPRSSPPLLACSYRCERERVESTNAAPTLRVTDTESTSAQTTWIVCR